MGQELFYGYHAPNVPGVAERLDMTDRKILHYLDRNGRLSATAIAKALKLSREVVDYRIRQMTNRGILTGFTTLVDVKRLGQMKHLVYLRLQNFTKEREDELVAAFKKNRNVVWVASCGGGWDLGLLVSSNDLEEFASVFNEITRTCGGNMSDYIILNEIKEDFAGRGLLVEGFAPKEAPLDREGVAFQRAFKARKREQGAVALLPQDRKVLNALIAEPLIPLSRLAKEVGASVPTVRKSVSELIRTGVIFGFMPMVSFSKLGYQWHMTFLRFNEYSAQDERRLIEYFYQHPHILWYIKTVGPWNMQLSVFAKDAAHYREILNGLRKEFGTLIKDYDSIMIFNQHKYLHAI